jgi:hypothetical protein
MKKRIIIFAHVAVLLTAAILLFPTDIGRAIVQGTIGRFLPMGTAITYQGRLTAGGLPPTGSYDLQFKLYDAAAEGSQVGVTVEKTAVALQDGLFSVTLDFGAGAFTGDARWLEIGVRENGNPDPYTVLEPRQPITPVPYAINAGSFSGTLSGDVTGGQGNTSVIRIQGLPVSTATPITGEVLKFDGSIWAPGADNAAHYENVIVVAKSGGNFTTITDALNSITTNDDSNRFLIKVAPGTYTEQVTMKPYVDIEGSGKMNTKIMYEGHDDIWSASTGTVYGSDNSELRSLIVENTGNHAYAAAINLSYASPTLSDLSIISQAGATATYGIRMFHSSPIISNVDVVAAATDDYVYGIQLLQYCYPKLTDIHIAVSGGSYNSGVYNDVSWPTFHNVIMKITGTEGSTNQGVYVNYSTGLRISDLDVTATGGANNTGVYVVWTSPITISRSRIIVAGGTTNYGIYNNFDVNGERVEFVYIESGYGIYYHNQFQDFFVDSSVILGNIYSLYDESGPSPCRIHVGSSQLSGPVSANGANYYCVFAYDANYSALNNLCQ